MLADVAVGERAEDRIDERMQRHVGVGMAGQPAVVRDLHAAEHDVIAVAEGVHVEAVAEPQVGEARDAPRLGPGEILGGGQLHVAAFAREHRDLEAGPFGERGVVGEIVAARRRGLAMRVEQRREREGLRRLHRAQARARSTVPATWPSASTRLIVSVTARAGIAAPVFVAGRDRARDQRRRAERPRRVVHQHDVRGARAERLEAGPHRGLPGRAARDRRQQPQPCGGCLIVGPVVGMDDRLHRTDLAMPGEQRQARADHRFARQMPVLLG